MHAASRDEEERNSSAVLRNLWQEEEEILVRLFEMSDLPFIGAREGGERLRWELKRMRETKRTGSRRRGAPFVFNLHYSKTFQLSRDLSYTRSAWQKFTSARLIPATRDATRRGVARRAAEEERAWMSLLFSCSYKWGRSLPYKEVQLPLN